MVRRAEVLAPGAARASARAGAERVQRARSDGAAGCAARAEGARRDLAAYCRGRLECGKESGKKQPVNRDPPRAGASDVPQEAREGLVESSREYC